MDTEKVKQEIKKFLDYMGFGEEEVVGIEARQGTTNRMEVVLKDKGSWAANGEPLYPESSGGNEREDGGYKSHANMLIGEQGRNLVALEHLLKKIVRKKYGEGFKFTLDINDYRIRRLEALKQDIKNAAKEVRMYRRQAVLRPMSSFERRVIHLLLAEYPDIATESIGEEPNRRVVIKPYP